MLIDELDLKKKYLLLSLILGFLSFFAFPEPNFDFKFMTHGFYIGLALGIGWTGAKYYKNKQEGIIESRKSLSIFVIYTSLYLIGYAVPYFVSKLLMLFF